MITDVFQGKEKSQVVQRIAKRCEENTKEYSITVES